MFAIRERVFDDHGADVGAHTDLHAFGCGIFSVHNSLNKFSCNSLSQFQKLPASLSVSCGIYEKVFATNSYTLFSL